MSIFFRKDDLVNKEELGEKLWELERYVARYLRTFGLKDDVLEDAVQETLMNGWIHIEQLRDVSRMKWWVRSIARNVGLKYAKKINQKRIREFSLEETLDKEVYEEDGEVLCKELWTHMENMELEQADKLLSCLNEREKNVVLLHYAFLHPFEEVAQILGITCANARKISSRAIEKMREYAAKEDGCGK